MAALKTLDASIVPLAQRNYSIVLKTFERVTQAKVAELLGCAQSSLSDFKDDHLERACQILAAAGLKVVSRDESTFPAQKIAALKLLAREALDNDGPPSEWGPLA